MKTKIEKPATPAAEKPKKEKKKKAKLADFPNWDAWCEYNVTRHQAAKDKWSKRIGNPPMDKKAKKVQRISEKIAALQKELTDLKTAEASSK